MFTLGFLFIANVFNVLAVFFVIGFPDSAMQNLFINNLRTKNLDQSFLDFAGIETGPGCLTGDMEDPEMAAHVTLSTWKTSLSSTIVDIRMLKRKILASCFVFSVAVLVLVILHQFVNLWLLHGSCLWDGILPTATLRNLSCVTLYSATNSTHLGW